MSCCQKSDRNEPLQKADRDGGQGATKIGEGDEAVWGAVKQYYGQTLTGAQDCQTGVNCLSSSTMPPHLRQALAQVHEEVTSKYYGCGLVIPEAVEGCSVLDLGSGTGQDCFIVSQLVGPKGRVVGIDMTEEQLAVARKYVDYHTTKFGYSQPNVDFVMGHIEKLQEAGLKENTFDVVISNCVINLSPDKTSVLKEAFRVLKEGGELYFSDIYTNTNLPPEIKQHRLLWGECVAGALHWQELYRLAQQIGFCPPRMVATKPVDVSRFSDILGEAKFVSVTYRLFKLPAVEPSPCTATYMGGILGSPDQLTLDHATTFKKNVSAVVDKEVAAILSSSRFRHFFTFNESESVIPITVDPKVDPFQRMESCCSTKRC